NAYSYIAIRPAGAPRPEPDKTRLVLAIPAPDGRIVDVGLTAAELLDTHSVVEPPGELAVFVAPPNETSLYATIDGRVLWSSLSGPGFDSLRNALDHNRSTVRVSRSDAAEVGLLARTAMASLVHIDAGDLGRWGIIAVGTAARPRDREARAFW